MNKAERAELRDLVTPIIGTWEDLQILELLNALDARDALIADLLDFSEKGWAYASDYFRTKWKYEERLAALKARATQ